MSYLNIPDLQIFSMQDTSADCVKIRAGHTFLLIFDQFICLILIVFYFGKQSPVWVFWRWRYANRLC